MGSSISKSDNNNNNLTEENINNNKKTNDVLIDDKSKITKNSVFFSDSSNKLVDKSNSNSNQSNDNKKYNNNHKPNNSNLTRFTHKQLITSRYIPKNTIMNNSKEKGQKSNNLELNLRAKYLSKSAFDFRGIMLI
jgi:hypothetical protein